MAGKVLQIVGLEDFLLGQVDDVAHDSSGTFTLDSEAAIAKLGQFRLPRAEMWCLKLIQFAVAAGATCIRFSLEKSETIFLADLPKDWTMPQLEKVLLSANPETQAGLDDLKQAFWQVGFYQGRPFRCCLPQSCLGLSWSRSGGFSRSATEGQSAFSLSVSHRGQIQGEELSSSALKRRIAEILEELNHHAFVCPVPLEVDGHRLDSLLRCPSHGATDSSTPVTCLLTRGQAPLWKVSIQATPVSDAKSLNRVRMPQSLRRARHLGLEVSGVLLLSVQGQPHQDRSRAHSRQRFSSVYWVREGVVVEVGILPDWPLGALSFAIFLSAQGLPSDLSDFSVSEGEESDARVLDLLKGLGPQVRDLDLLYDEIGPAPKSPEQMFGAALLLAGLTLGYSFPPLGVVAGIAGVANLIAPGQRRGKLRLLLKEALGVLQTRWSQVCRARESGASSISRTRLWRKESSLKGL